MCEKLQPVLFRKITIAFFLNLTIFSFAQCKTVEKKTSQDDTSSTFIQPMTNDTSISKLNGDKSMELHVKKIMKKGDPALHFEYIVYKTGTKNIIKQGSFRGTAIEWNDNTSLKLIPYIGIEQKPISENPEEVSSTNNQTRQTIINLNKN